MDPLTAPRVVVRPHSGSPEPTGIVDRRDRPSTTAMSPTDSPASPTFTSFEVAVEPFQDSHRYVITILDPASGEVIAEMPPRKLLEMVNEMLRQQDN